MGQPVQSLEPPNISKYESSQVEDFQPTPGKVGERSQALLFEAFGSMNLGKPGEMQGRHSVLS